MKTWKKLLSLLLVAALCLALLAACASKTETQPEDTPTQEPQDSEPAENPQDGEAPAETSEDENPAPAEDPDDGEEDETVEIVMAILDMKGDNSNYDAKIEEAVNAITGPAIGVTVDLKYYDYGNYATQISLAVSGGEVLDLVNIVPLPGIAFNELYSNGELLDISSYLAEDYAKDLMNVVGDYVGGYSIGGGIYAVPTYRIYTSDNYIVMRKDILEELGMVELAENLSTQTELDQIFGAVKQNTDLYPIGGSKRLESPTSYRCFHVENFADSLSWDNLGDSTYLLMTDKDGHVFNGFTDPSFEQMCQNFTGWMEKGYIWPDTITNEDTSDSIIKQGVIFCTMDLSEYGVEVAKKETTGYEVVCPRVAYGEVTNSRVIGFGLGVPVTSEEPEAAIRFLNLLYNSSELMNILTWGIEGEDYVTLPTGEIDYPEGLDPSTVEYHNADYLLGNQFLDAPWAGNGGDFRARALEVNENAQISPYLSFALDVSALGDQITAIGSVVDEYTPNLISGYYTPELYQQFVEKLEAAGAQTYIDACQTQLDAWAAAQ